MVKGAPHPELAEQFIRYVLSPEGQLLWNLKPGTPGGPVSSALRRLPIRRDVYADMSNFTDQVNPFKAASSFNKRNEREKTFPIIGELIQASCIDPLDDLALTRKTILASPAAATLDARLGRFPFDQKEALARMEKYGSNQTTVRERLALQRQWSLDFKSEYSSLREQAKRPAAAVILWEHTIQHE
jgi:spermidine/putrescine-binding protein